MIDVAVVNSAAIRPAARRRYAREQAEPVENDLANIRAMGVQVVQAELVQQSEVVRHDPRKAAIVAMRLARASRRKNDAATGENKSPL